MSPDNGALARIRSGLVRGDLALARAVKEELERSGGLAEMVGPLWAPRQVRYQDGRGGALEMNLTNLALLASRLPGAEAADEIQAFVARALEDLTSRMADRLSLDRVLPVVKAAGTWSAIRDLPAPLSLPLSSCGSIKTLLVHDAPNSVRFLTEQDLGELGAADASELLDPARENLERLTAECDPPLRVAAPVGPSDVCSVMLDGFYESSLILLNDVLESLLGLPPLSGAAGVADLALAVPARDALLIADRNDRRALRSLAAAARQAHAGAPYAVSEKVYVRVAERLRPL